MKDHLIRYRNSGKKYLEILSLLNKHRSGEIVTWVSRNLNRIPNNLESFNEKNIGIILQGPTVSEHDYTLRFAQFYKQLHPEIEVVVSTWNTRYSRRLKTRLEELGVHVLLGDQPATSGRANVNLQIQSTHRGLKFLEELGIMIALKTRTDQVLANPRFLEVFCGHLLRVGEGRIVVSSFNSFAPPSTSISDMIQFGLTTSLLKFWELPNAIDIESDSQSEIPEIYLMRRYLARLINTKSDELNVRDLDLLKEFFVIVDSNALDQVWVKKSTLDIKGYWRTGKKINLSAHVF